jgi:hypothetical protein
MKNAIFSAEADEAFARTTPLQRLLMEDWGKKIYLGHEQREGWIGSLPFYLFYCAACKHHAKDYPHGYAKDRYLWCSHCGMYHRFVP